VNENELSRMIVDAAVEVHRVLGGPGLLECVYEEAFAWELSSRGLSVERQYELPVNYKGNLLGSPLRLDLLVNRHVVVEVKATSNFNPIFESQLLTYLRISNLRLGLLVNFGEKLVKDGIRRVVNKLEEPALRL
jgi:GxxExxY protein